MTENNPALEPDYVQSVFVELTKKQLDFVKEQVKDLQSGPTPEDFNEADVLRMLVDRAIQHEFEWSQTIRG